MKKPSLPEFQFITHAPDVEGVLRQIHMACVAGVPWIQLRMKEYPVETVHQAAREARKITRDYGVLLTINDYPDIAREVEADFVHIGLEDMPVQQARALAGESIYIGATANTFAHIKSHASYDVCYIGLGPLRFTTTKSGLKPVLGYEGYRTILEKCRNAGIDIPVIAIGGVKADDIPHLLGAGVAGVAISSWLLAQPDFHSGVKQLKALFNSKNQIPC